MHHPNFALAMLLIVDAVGGFPRIRGSEGDCRERGGGGDERVGGGQKRTCQRRNADCRDSRPRSGGIGVGLMKPAECDNGG